MDRHHPLGQSRSPRRGERACRRARRRPSPPSSRRALAQLPERELRRIGRQPPGARRSPPRDRRCSTSPPGRPRSRSAWAAPSAARWALRRAADEHDQQARSRTGRACPRARSSRRRSARRPRRRRRARSSRRACRSAGRRPSAHATSTLRRACRPRAVGRACSCAAIALAQEGDQLVGLERRREARRAAVAAAALDARAITETSTSSSVARSETLRWPAALAAAQLAHERRDLRALERPQLVDDALGVAVARRSARSKSAALSTAIVSSPSSKRWMLRERERQQRELARRHRPRRAGGRPPHVDARLDQLGGHQVRPRRRVLVHEAPGVGDQPDVERLARSPASGRRRARASGPRRSPPCRRPPARRG